MNSAPRYRSTRTTDGPTVDFSEALRAGIAPDGGLYLPESVPPLPGSWREASSLAELAVAVLEPWFGPDAPRYEAALRRALDFEVPLRPLSGGRFLLELFHGPTLAFKDVGARAMARLLATDLAPGERLTILVATSGDTGSAVADGFSGVEGIEVVLLYPDGMVSEVQERQLIVERPGVRAFAVAGTFDDCQRLVKAAFGDPELASIRLSSANSINIGRLLPQMLYYLWGGLQLERVLGREAASSSLICVPSGNLGNLTAAVLAGQMGWRSGPLLAAHNANDFFPEFLAGERHPYAFDATRGTVSNAMDVGAPSNFERLHVLLGERLSEMVSGISVDDASTLDRIRSVWRSEAVAVCPHTAVGLEAVARWRQRSGDLRPALVVATAHPAKFPHVLERALGVAPPTHPALETLRGRPTRVEPLAADLDALRARLLDTAAASG